MTRGFEVQKEPTTKFQMKGQKIMRKFFSIFVLVILLVSAIPVFAQDGGDLPEVGDYYAVNVSGVQARIAPDVRAPNSEVIQLNTGGIVRVLEVREVDGNVWILTEYGWMAFQYEGSDYFIPATAAQINQRQNEAQSGGGVLVLDLTQQPIHLVDGDDLVLVGFATSFQESPAELSVPEGGYAFFARELSAGIWEVVEYIGNPDDHTATDRNHTVSVDFTGNNIAVYVFGDLDRGDALIALITELFKLEPTAVQFQADTYTSAPESALDFNLVREDNLLVQDGQGGAESITPDGSTDLPMGNGYSFFPTADEFIYPLHGNGEEEFTIFAMSPATFSINEWQLTTSANYEANGQSYEGQAGNLVIFVNEEGVDDPLLFVEEYSEGNMAVNHVNSEESPAQSGVANGRMMFEAKNCGRGCQFLIVYVVYVQANGNVSVVSRVFVSAESVTEETIDQLVQSVYAQQGTGIE